MDRETTERLKRLAEARRLLPPCDRQTEQDVLCMIIHGQEQADIVFSLVERADFYSDENATLYGQLKELRGGNGERQETSRAVRFAGLQKKQATRAEIESSCSLLRELRRQRRIDLAAEEIYLSHERRDWVQVAEREIEAVKSIAAVVKYKESVNGKPKARAV